jgi:hypothetical protein
MAARKERIFSCDGLRPDCPLDGVGVERFTIDVPTDLHARIKIACAERGKVMADEIRRLLEAELRPSLRNRSRALRLDVA